MRFMRERERERNVIYVVVCFWNELIYVIV